MSKIPNGAMINLLSYKLIIEYIIDNEEWCEVELTPSIWEWVQTQDRQLYRPVETKHWLFIRISMKKELYLIIVLKFPK